MTRDEGHDAITGQVFEALTLHFLLKRHELGSPDPVEALARIRIMGMLVDHLYLELAKLGERKRDSCNFEQALRQLPDHRTEQYKSLRGRINEYRCLIDALLEHRNKRIAHRAKAPWSDLRPPVEAPAALHPAVDLVDELTGKRNDYFFVDVDLRSSILDQHAA